MTDDPFESSDDAPAPSGVDLMQLVALPVWRARVWIVLATCAAAAAGAVQSLLKPNEFSSFGKFLVRPGIRESTTPEGRVIGDSSGPSLNLREAVQNQIHLLQNPEVSRRVVADLGAKTVLEPYDPTRYDDASTPFYLRWSHKFQREWFGRSDACLSDPGREIDDCPRCVDVAEDAISKGIYVFPEAGSSVLTVVYTAHSPEVATKVVDAFLRSALSHHQQVFDLDSTLQFLDERVLQATVAADLADQELTRYRQSCGLFEYEEQRTRHLAQIDSLETELAANETKLAELRTQLGAYNEALQSEPLELENVTALAPIPNPQYESLLLQRQQFSNELAALDPAAFTTKDQLEARRRQLRDRIAQIDENLEQTPRMNELPPLRTAERNPRRDVLPQRVREIEAETKGLVQGQGSRRARIAELRQELDRFEECRPELATKERRAKLAENELKQFLARRQAAALANQLDSTALTNLAVLQSATYPRNKSGPQRSRTVMIAAALGAAAATSLAVLRNVLVNRRNPVPTAPGAVGEAGPEVAGTSAPASSRG